MPKATPLINQINVGEISGKLDARVDVQKYYGACRTLENMIPMPQGGAFRRPGTYYVYDAKSHTKKSRLLGFHFSTVQAYILEFSDQKIRVFKDHGIVTSGGNPYEISTTYTEAELFDLKFVQSADTLYIAHPSHAPATLVRTDHANWTLANISFTWGSGEAFTTGNYPSCVAFFEQRLAWAATAKYPQRVWLSKSADYSNMDTGTSADDDALVYTIVSDKVDKIHWMLGADYLMLGTVGGIWRLGGTTISDPLTPANVNAKRQATFGCKDIEPEMVGDAVLYVQRGGNTVRELFYTYNKPDTGGGYSTTDVTIMAEHIAKGSTQALSGITDLDFQAEPFSILHTVRADGQLPGMVYERDQQVVGWFRTKTGIADVIESVAVITEDDNEDEVWISVNRTINGETKRYIEYFKPHEFFGVLADYFGVDCGLTFDGGAAVEITGITRANPTVVTAPDHSFTDGMKVRIKDVEGMTEANIGQLKAYTVANASGDTFELSGIDSTGWTDYTSGGTAQQVAHTISGLDHLEGEKVDILADGAHEATQVVVSGAIALARYSNKIHVGLPFRSIYEPMKVEIAQAEGTSQGKKKHISELTARFYQTFGAKWGPNLDMLDDISFGDGEAPALYTGEKKAPFPATIDTAGSIFIVQDLPMPMTILAVIPEVSISNL